MNGALRWMLFAVALLFALGAIVRYGTPAAQAARAPASPPVLAYYYIWFDESSWQRAKTDVPALGEYSSDDRDVIKQHIAWAKSAGIDGFIVSWKSTPRLNRRLEYLIDAANAADFKLVIIYEGLDFLREPLPATTVARDLDLLIDRYASEPAFRLFSQPLVIWSGTWKFSASDIDAVSRSRRDRLLLLASEKNIDGYRRVSASVDGDAYYWSSVNPDETPGYAEKLQALAAEVHAGSGLWIAPAAPGFDARGVGGTSVVARNDGQVLRREMAAAAESAPDAIGVISWNEFSENTHIEPSARYGTRYLEIMGATTSATGDQDAARGDAAVDSSSPAGRGIGYRLPFAVAALFAALSTIALVRNHLRSRVAGVAAGSTVGGTTP